VRRGAVRDDGGRVRCRRGESEVDAHTSKAMATLRDMRKMLYYVSDGAYYSARGENTIAMPARWPALHPVTSWLMMSPGLEIVAILKLCLVTQP